MNRFDLQKLAGVRIWEARTLLRASLFDGAYYLAGYAVECALKACIAKRTKEFDFPDKTLVEKAYTHNLTQLVGIAELQTELESRRKSDKDFDANWATAKDWSETARYNRYTEEEARDLYRAVAGRKGVLQWLRGHW